MGFVPISIDKYIKKHLESNPSENEKDLRKHLDSALEDYNIGVKCSCGNDIWVIGSAFAGNSCFTCITRESQFDSDYEIDLAIKKMTIKKVKDILTQWTKNRFMDFLMTTDLKLIWI